jgi:cob(I)alamin adenosyltransferase
MCPIVDAMALQRQYVNPLSYLLFLLARVLNRHAGGDVLWQKGRNAPH